MLRRFTIWMVILLIVVFAMLTACSGFDKTRDDTGPKPEAWPCSKLSSSRGTVVYTTYVYAGDDLIAKSIRQGNDSCLAYLIP